MGELKPLLLDDIKALGAFDVNACYSCGVCTAICPLSEEGGEFPRRLIRYATLGLEDKLLGSPLLWACYYCGECTRSCPRKADPGGFMHAARKYAIIKYSVGGIASAFYNKTKAIIAYAVLNLAFLLGMYLTHGHIVTTRVDIYSLFSRNLIHLVGAGLGVYVLVAALANIYVFYKKIKAEYLRDVKVKASEWLRSFFKILFREFLWQSRYLSCENKFRFVAHMMIFWGFLLTFAATASDFLAGHRVMVGAILGVTGGVLLTAGSIYFVAKRIRIDEEYATESDMVDWIFILLVLLAGLTGFTLDPLIDAGRAIPAYAAFIIHLVIVYNLIVTAPFTKFAHAGYRPLALIFMEAKKQATHRQ